MSAYRPVHTSNNDDNDRGADVSDEDQGLLVRPDTDADTDTANDLSKEDGHYGHAHADTAMEGTNSARLRKQRLIAIVKYSMLCIVIGIVSLCVAIVVISTR
jgi:hypothetical protein